MKKTFILLTGIAFLFLSCGSSQTKNPSSAAPKAPVKQTKSVTDYANSISSEELKTDLYIYASDEFEGRETGTAGQKKAVNFLKDRYVELGIPSPISSDDYFQEVPLEIKDVPKVSLSIAGKAYTFKDDFVAISGNTGHFSAGEIVYAGYGIVSENYNSYTDLDVKGKVVLVKYGEPQNADGIYLVTGSEKASKWSNFVQEYRAKRDAAIAKGAKAILYYNPKAYDFMAARYAQPSNRMALQGSTDEIYYLFLNESIVKNLVPDIETQHTAAVVNQNIEVSYQNTGNQFHSENVLALIKGSQYPDEVIVISSHLDHEGIKDGQIYNGADDDGSGSVAMLEIAEAFQEAVKDGNGPKRSILFLHVTGEEKGLLGSRYYTDMDPVIPLENTVANLNIDMIGRIDTKHENTPDKNYLYLIGSDKLSTELHNLSESVNNSCCNIELDYTYNDENDPNRFYYRSDHYNFAKNNIPVIFYFNGTHADYHKPSDTPDKINYPFLQDRTRLIFQTAWEIANRDKRLVVDKTFQ
ncbi:MAG TPA: M28 family peptidase [Flavobacteriaceae bacterium]|nr:M28 family peptidase [Flavobacteriaceae bacterium]